VSRSFESFVGSKQSTGNPSQAQQKAGDSRHDTGQTKFGAKLVNLAATGTNDPDRNPSRLALRNLFDTSVGDDNLFRGDRHKWSLRFTVINLTNKTAVYNFLSTFSGTHFVTPRSETVELAFHF